ncbi:MAG TPA: hypothetical protein VGD37_42165 [Kofleriaceae bacterium]
MRRFSLVALIVAGFTACGDIESSPGTPPAAGARAARAGATGLEAEISTPTSRVLAEALVIYDRSLSGTEAHDFARAQFVHLPVVDFSDRPFEDLVFTSGVTPHPGSRYTSCDDGTLTTAVGATRAQIPVSWSRCGTDLQDRIQRLGEQIGADKVDAIVGADASSYLLRVRDGSYWDLGTRSLLTPDQVDELRSRYEAAWAEAGGNGTPEQLQGSWAMFDGAEQELAPFTRKDGSLDVPAALDQVAEPSILQQVEEAGQQPSDRLHTNAYSTWNGTCYRYWFFGWHDLGCDRYEEGHHAAPHRTQAHYPNQYSGFTVPKCFSPGTETNVAGCAPAAFGSLVDWLWRMGTPIAGAGFSHGNEPYTGAGGWSPRPNQNNLYRRVETDSIALMGSCGLGGSGVLTLPAGFIAGGNAWLAGNAPGVVMNQIVGTFLANFFLGDAWANRLRDRIGNDRGPVVAGFHIDSLGAFDYHYSPVKQYFVERPLAWFSRVRIESIDGYSSYLTNPWSFFSATYWLDGNIGGCRFGDEKYAWSCSGPIPGYACTQINEPSDPDTWTDNYFCYRNTPYSFSWSSAGPIGGQNCTQILETADPHTWSDNYLCTNGPFTSWTSAWNTGNQCFRWSEPSDPHTWDDNFLCTP